MAKGKLVTGHLERVSGKLFESHPTAIRSLIKGKSGVYALYKNDSLYYIGLASNLMRRLKKHQEIVTTASGTDLVSISRSTTRT